MDNLIDLVSVLGQLTWIYKIKLVKIAGAVTTHQFLCAPLGYNNINMMYISANNIFCCSATDSYCKMSLPIGIYSIVEFLETGLSS